MNIALIAHDMKKELMSSFCIAYKGILEKHTLYATASTAAIIAESTGLHLNCFSPGELGGVQQLNARVAYNEIDMVIFLRDPQVPEKEEADLNALFRLCDANIVPFATNIATAEVLIKGLDRGDLDWRELVNPINLNI